MKARVIWKWDTRNSFKIESKYFNFSFHFVALPFLSVPACLNTHTHKSPKVNVVDFSFPIAPLYSIPCSIVSQSCWHRLFVERQA